MKHIRLKQKHRAAIAWMLFLMLMPLFAVKAAHFHDDESCAHADRSHHHSSGNCEICLFVLSDFTEAESFHFRHLQTFAPLIRPVTEEEGACATILSPTLRAPPVAV
ncbi:hypothetical protein M1B74_02640 [Bacteroides pyogenes]|uniref:hypothetical protein n=1 Tax=Bacteroides pyogenes TaxID=310300 RepID=UPI003B4349C7